MRKSKKACIKKITRLVNDIKKNVINDRKATNGNVNPLENLTLKNVEYMPTPFDIAKYYGIRYKFIQIDGNEPSYLERKNLIIYISDRYRDDSYATRILLAHELGHFFLHDKLVSEMNNYPRKTKEEYEANVFSIILMPQIMAGVKWTHLPPEELNQRVYKKVSMKNDS